MEARYVTLDDVFVAQFGSASSARRVIKFAVKDILGQSTISHMMHVTQTVQKSLPRGGDEVV